MVPMINANGVRCLIYNSMSFGLCINDLNGVLTGPFIGAPTDNPATGMLGYHEEGGGCKTLSYNNKNISILTNFNSILQVEDVVMTANRIQVNCNSGCRLLLKLHLMAKH